MDEVSDPSMAVLAEGSFFKNGGPKSYILNKIENTYKSTKTRTIRKTSLNTCTSTALLIGQKKQHYYFML